MKKYFLILIFVFLFVIGCTAEQDNGKIQNTANFEQVNLQIEDMTCQSCALGVEYELKQVDGVVDAKVNYQDGTGVVTFDPTKIQPEDVAKASTVYPAHVVK